VLNGEKLTTTLKADSPLMIDSIDHPYDTESDFVKKIKNRGL